MQVPATFRAIRNALPAGRTLPVEAWQRRHRWMVISLWLQIAAISAYTTLRGYGPLHSIGHVVPMLAATLLAQHQRIPQRARSASVAMAMFTAAAVAVHTSGGAIEAHFYFFVVIVVLSLYEDWLPFLLAIGFVVIHHGLLGTIDSTGVYATGSPGAADPWGTALIHGAFVTAAGAASVIGWRLNEDIRIAAQRSQEQFQRSFEDAPIGMALASEDGRCLAVNRALCALLGYDEAELLDRRIDDFAVHKADVAPSSRLFDRDCGEVSVDNRYRHRNGATVWAAVRVSRLTEAGNLDAHFIIQMEDITARKQAEHEAAVVANQQQDVLALSRSALSATKLTPFFAEAVRVLARNLGAPDVRVVESGRLTATPPRVVAELASVPGSAGEKVKLTPGESSALAAADSVSHIGEIVAVITDHDEQPYGTLAVSAPGREFDAQEIGFVMAVGYVLSGAVRRSRSEDELRHQSLHDPLLGLPNRVLFLDRVHRALARSRRSERCAAVIFIDLDRFKNINDSLGHGAGDVLLQTIAPRLSEALRDNDTLARFGGDEFVILCEDLTDSAQALDVARRVHQAFDDPYRIGDHEHVISASIGVAVSGEQYVGHPEALVRDADAAMYRAKAAGGDRIELFDEVLRARVVRRLEIETGLRKAIAENELTLHYQPIVDLTTGRITRCEALVRWQHPERGLVPPDEFIGIAEETGLILPLGAWVIEKACGQLAEWQRGDHAPVLAEMAVSINLSALQVVQDDLAATVSATLDRHGVQADRLICEITETSLIRNPDAAEQTLLALEQLGVKVALDDFGTGYSSLASLKRFPLSAIKLDRSFISEMTPGSRDAAIIEPLLTMAESLGLMVVAEGVETSGQCEQLRAMGCELAQGYLYGRPADPQEFARRLFTLGAVA
ncbi:MAG TPA: EAL domain-containing protein [Baekduia sp.]|nr:EAL domain-containing protein [Baekduia sp.]